VGAAGRCGRSRHAIHQDLGFALLQLQRWDCSTCGVLRSKSVSRRRVALLHRAVIREARAARYALNYLKLLKRDAQRLDPRHAQAL